MEDIDWEAQKNQARVALAKKHGSYAIFQGKINDAWVLFWVWKWGWTTNQLIQRLINVARSRPADDFVRKGLLIKIEAPAGHPENHVYILSQEGYIKAELMAEQLYPDRKNHYFLHTSKRVQFSLNSHNLLAQHIALDMMWPIDKSKTPDEFDYERLKTDYELRSSDRKTNQSIADFSIILTEDGNRLYRHVEIETNQKTNEKLHKWLMPRVALANKYYAEYGSDFAILVLTPFNGVIESYSETLTKRIIKVVKVGDRDVFQRDSSIKLERANIQFSKLVKSPLRKSGGFSFDFKNAMIIGSCFVNKNENENSDFL